MTKFLSKILMVGASITFGYMLLAQVLISKLPEVSYYFFDMDWLRIYTRIYASQRQISKDTVYVGCSVAGQFLPFNNDNFLTSNGAVYPIGNYFLIKNVLQNNPNVNCIIYLSVPNVLGDKMSQDVTYKYFVKPFYTLENRKEILASPTVSQVLKKNKFLDLNLLNGYKLLSLDDFNYDDFDKTPDDFLSPECIEWLIKIENYCIDNEVSFHLVSPPVPIGKREATNNWNGIRKQVEGTILEETINTYLNSIIYVDNQYLSDENHWQKSFVKEHSKLVLEELHLRLNPNYDHRDLNPLFTRLD